MEDFMRMEEERLQAAQARIDQQEVSIEAIHRVNISEKDIQEQLQLDPDWTSLTLDYLLEITESLYLVNLKTSDIGVIDIQLSGVTQDNEHGQAPFAEKYFDSIGENLLKFENEYDTRPSDSQHVPGHVRFYMHYFDPDLELEFGNKMLALPKPSPLPGWLAKLMPYQPPN